MKNNNNNFCQTSEFDYVEKLHLNHYLITKINKKCFVEEKKIFKCNDNVIKSEFHPAYKFQTALLDLLQRFLSKCFYKK